MIRCTILIILLHLLAPNLHASQIPLAKKKLQVYLLAGQSNMDGRANGGDLSSEDLARLEKVADRINFYNNHKPVSNLQFTPSTPYLKEKFKFDFIFGPELFFGIEMAEKYPDEEFIFIKRALGGTSLYGCWNPNWTYEKAKISLEENKPKLYFDFRDYVKEVLKDYSYDSYEIKGMLWVQGEADSNIMKRGEKPANSYGENLQALVNAVRNDFNQPELPFVLFQVGKGKVVEGMKETTRKDPNVYLIPQSDDKKSTDFYAQYDPPLWHYTTESMKRIGIAFYKSFSEIYK